jgi:hypothetical protein
VGIRPAPLLVAALLLALALASPAQAAPRSLRYQVTVKGEQTATWSIKEEGACGNTLGGTQTISFESLRRDPLSLRRFRPPGRKRDSYIGGNLVPTNWTFTRTFQRTTPPGCGQPPPEPVVAQATDCGTKGPYVVPRARVGWRGGAVEFAGELSPFVPGQREPDYKTCEYEGVHQFELIDSKGRLSQRRLTSRRPIRVRVTAREKTSYQTTTLVATVTLRRVR